MKRAIYRLARRAARSSVVLGVLASASLSAQITTLIDCPNGPHFDNTSRGFYLTNYPGTSINGVTVYLRTQSATSYQYQVGLTVTEGTFNGPVVASWFADATLNNTEKAVSIQMVSPPPQRTNPPVNSGSTLCFKFFINEQRGAPTVFFAVNGNIGQDLPDATDPCPNLVQTNGTAPPLSSFRREGVKLQITGNKYLNVNSGQSIQLAIDNADPGDTVSVAPGNYNEDLILRSGIDVQGAGAGEAILTGTGSGNVVAAQAINNMEFSGFTVQGSGTGNSDAGFRIVNSNIIVRNNTITGNATGIYSIGSTSFICSNLITGNGNESNGIRDFAVRCSGNDLFSGNRIVQNLEWGALAIGAGNTPQFINNTVADNAGGGLQAAFAAPILKNTIVSGNGSIGIFAENNATIESTYNCIFSNSPNESEVRGGVITDRTGDFFTSPQFDAAQPGDYVLDDPSPCIDAGDPLALYNDLDGSRSDVGATGGLCGSATPPGSIVSGFVWTSVGTYANLEDIEQSGPKRGLTKDRDRPFGGKPWFFGAFGNSETSVARYAVKIAKWTGSTPPADPEFSYRDDPLSKVRFDISGGTVASERIALGPFDVAGKPTYLLTRNNGNIFWAHENLRMLLDTRGLDNGTYSVRMEGFNLLGGSVPLTVNNDIIVRVNNTEPVVSIDAVSLGGGSPFGECSIIDLSSSTATLDFVYTASHPDGFLDNYSLDALVGRNRSGGTIVRDSYSNHLSPTATWNGVTSASVAATPVSPAAPLPTLQPWESCAYQFRLRAWSRTTNGFGRIYHDTFFDNYALDLEPANQICTPDLDGDGDVDAQDLALMAAAYGNAQ